MLNPPFHTTEAALQAGMLTQAQAANHDKLKAAMARVLGLIDQATFDAIKAA